MGENIKKISDIDIDTAKWGTRKIADLPKQEICRHPEHNPAGYRVYEEGVYEHTCPACGKKQIFTVRKPTLE